VWRDACARRAGQEKRRKRAPQQVRRRIGTTLMRQVEDFSSAAVVRASSNRGVTAE
jgi:hypothetical protein